MSRERAPAPRWRRLAPLAPLALATIAVGALLEAIGLASGYLFAALLVGLAAALVLPRHGAEVPPRAFVAAQAVLGVTLGTYVEGSSVSALAGSWLPVAAVTLGTLVVSLAVGLLLARRTSLDEPTGALGMVAGGASGIVAMADELGADSRLVAFMQYLRVLVVVLSIPLVATVAFAGGDRAGAIPADGPLLGTAEGWALTVLVAIVGATLGRLTRLTAAGLLGPLLLAGAIGLFDGDALAVPPLLRETAFGLIGLQVGLRFTVAVVREIGRLLAPVLAAIGLLMALSFLLALLLAATSPAPLLDSYLATTPGGIYSVLAVAFSTGADTTFVVALQTLRLITLVVLAPFAVRWIVRRASSPSVAGDHDP